MIRIGMKACSLAALLAAGTVLAAGGVSLNGDWRLSYFPQPDFGEVRTHASYDRAAEQMAKIIEFKGISEPEQQRKSG